MIKAQRTIYFVVLASKMSVIKRKNARKIVKNDTKLRQKQPKQPFVVTMHLVVTTSNYFIFNTLLAWWQQNNKSDEKKILVFQPSWLHWVPRPVLTKGLPLVRHILYSSLADIMKRLLMTGFFSEPPLMLCHTLSVRQSSLCGRNEAASDSSFVW